MADHVPTFADLERKYAKPAEELLDALTVALQEVDTETLLGIAEYREAIHPDGWMQTLIRQYVSVWR